MIARPAGQQPVSGDDGSGTSGSVRSQRWVWQTAVILAATIASAAVLKVFVVEAFRVPSASMERTLLPGDYVLVSKLAYGIHRSNALSATLLPTASSLHSSLIRRGDVIVFEYPGPLNPLSGAVRMPFIKRCIGLPGDEVALRGSQVLINGRALLLPSAKGIGADDHARSDWGPVTIPAAGTVISLSGGTFDRWRQVLEAEGQHGVISPDGSILLNGQPAREYTLRRNYYFVLGDNRGNSLDSRVWGFVPENAVIGKAVMVYWSWDPSVPTASLRDLVRRVRWARIGSIIR